MIKPVHLALLTVAMLAAGCGRGAPETLVHIRFKSSQINADYTGDARYAVAVPQSSMIKVYLFTAPVAGCEPPGRDLAVAELFVPTEPSAQPGIKFAPPSRPNWATGIPDNANLVKHLKVTDKTVSGCVNQAVNLNSAGNSGSIEGCFSAEVCPARPLDSLAAQRGSSSVDISMSLPGNEFERHVGNTIAFIAHDRVMVFFQDTERLTCENYRLVEKQGLFEFTYETGQTEFGPGDAARLAPVEPDSGWSFHFGPELLQVTEAQATISPDGKFISGSLDITSKGVDPLSLKEFFHEGLNPGEAEKVSCRVVGKFKAPVCPEF